MITRAALLLLCLAAGPATGDPLVRVPYGELEAELTERVDFELLPRRAEPGISLDHPIYAPGAWLGERFAGQFLVEAAAGHDRLAPGAPGAPLAIAAGAPGRNLSVAFHRGFGSNAVFPLGPAGFPAIDARGEGALAVLFESDQHAFALRIHAEYPDPLGARRGSGRVDLLVFSRDGSLIGRTGFVPGSGVTGFGLRRTGQVHDIAGFLVLNSDPGGIAIDDILFALPPPLG